MGIYKPYWPYKSQKPSLHQVDEDECLLVVGDCPEAGAPPGQQAEGPRVQQEVGQGEAAQEGEGGRSVEEGEQEFVNHCQVVIVWWQIERDSSGTWRDNIIFLNVTKPGIS